MAKRYDLMQVNACYTTDHEMEPADDGEWVRYEDVPMMEWQPIATAPKVSDFGCSPPDVLLYGATIGVRTGRACTYHDGSVFAGVSNISGNIAFSHATHWMPLPEPPK